ncbi:hypothetical protein BT69DRAFT_1213830 [Atractiella rhizophila]|nr:hypothetical protein BT69DRAFT_1213830 [Atractiella rhizophila]
MNTSSYYDPLSAPSPSQPQQHLTRPLSPRSPISQTERGLRSPSVPSTPITAQGQVPRVQENWFKVWVLGIERNRRDLWIKFDAETNLPSFRSARYKSVSRSYTELLRLLDALAASNPQIVIPALPLPQTSAPTAEEDEKIVKGNFQKWFTRIIETKILVVDEEFRVFVENDFGYTPISNKKKASSSSSGVTGFKNPLSKSKSAEVDPLSQTKIEMSRIESTFGEGANVIDRMAKMRTSLATNHILVSERLLALNLTPPSVTNPSLNQAVNLLSRTLHSMGDYEASEATCVAVTLGDVLAYQAGNAKGAKETLGGRAALLEEYRNAAKNAFNKRKNVEKLKGNPTRDRVDEALEELEEATTLESTLAQKISALNEHLTPSMKTHAKHSHADLVAAVVEQARSSLIYEKQILKELEMCKPLFVSFFFSSQ